MSKFVMFVGPMFGGKTTKLLGAVDRYRYQKREIYKFKPKIDGRYDAEAISTHWGGKAPASRVKSGDDLYAEISNNQATNAVIAVDEAFMIPGSARALIKLFGEGHTILVSSIQLSAAGEPFEEIKEMMPWATSIEVCPAVCTMCTNDAYFTQKLAKDVEHGIEVGGAELYEPRCRKHFKV